MATGFKTATVNASSVPATATNFPSYVDLSRLGITTLAEAQSVRVYAESGKTTEWAREIVSVSEMHVKVPSLTSTVAMYVDWDGVRADYAVTDTYGRNAVWSDYAAVYHLEGNSNDSTANGLNGTDTNVTYGSSFGVLGGQGISLSATGYINLSTSSILNFATTSYSLTSWAQPRASSGLMGVVSRRSSTSPNAGYGLGYDWTEPDGFSFIQRTIASANFEANFGASSSTNSWYHTAGVYNAGGNSFVYVDGTSSAALNTSSRGSISTTTNTYIGPLQGTSFLWNGYIDEVRLRASALSANWITTEYNNQSAESTFWGTWTDAGGGGGPTFVPRVSFML